MSVNGYQPTAGGQPPNGTHKVSDPPSATPIVKTFKTSAGLYAYDFNTGAILKLDPITFELLNAPQGYHNACMAQLTDRVREPDIAIAAANLAALSSKLGVFRPTQVKSRLVSPDFVERNWRALTGTFDHLTLEVTQQCNLRCRYCVFSGGYKNTRVHSPVMMSWPVARTAIDLFIRNPAHQLSRQYLTFYGGEPTTNMSLITRCVEYVRSVDSHVAFGMTTNGTMLDDRVREFIIANGFRLVVSVDGPEEVHDANRVDRKGKGTLATIVRHLRAIKDTAPDYYSKNVVFNCTVSPLANYRTLLTFFADNADLFRPDTVSFGFVKPGNEAYFDQCAYQNVDNGYSALEELFLERVVLGDVNDVQFSLLRQLFDTPYLFVHRRPIKLSGWGGTFHTTAGCLPGNFRLFVQADGVFRVCEKGNNALAIGDVDRGLDGRKICEMYRHYYNLFNEECRKCWALRFCQNCYATATSTTGEFDHRLCPDECDRVRRYWCGKLTRYAGVLEQNPKAFDYLTHVAVFRDRIPFIDAYLSDAQERRESTSLSGAAFTEGTHRGQTE